MNFHGKYLVAKSRAIADIGDSFVSFISEFHGYGIDPGFWAQFIMKNNICGWEP